MNHDRPPWDDNGRGMVWFGENYQYRLREGRKAADDEVLEWRYVGPWRPVTLDHVFVIVDAIAENEDRLYPHPQRGGEEVIRYVRWARQFGWREARRRLHEARAKKARQAEEAEEQAQ